MTIESLVSGGDGKTEKYIEYVEYMQVVVKLDILGRLRKNNL